MNRQTQKVRCPEDREEAYKRQRKYRRMEGGEQGGKESQRADSKGNPLGMVRRTDRDVP